MLGDNAEKSKNPLRIAMRRRHGKTVTFNEPLCFEAEEAPIDYSTGSEEEEEHFLEDDEEDEEEDEEEEEHEVHEKSAHTKQQQQQDASRKDEGMGIEPLRPKQQQKETAALQEHRSEHKDSLEEHNDDLDKGEFNSLFFIGRTIC